MSRDAQKSKNATEVQHATISNSGSGNVFYRNAFVPVPTIPVNGSNLPNQHPHFVGRKDKIQEVLNALASRAWIVGIDGMGGIGKTTLALEVAHICKKQSSDYQNIPKFTGYIWTSARDKQDFCLNDVIRDILYVLSPHEMTRKRMSQEEEVSLATRALAAEPRLLIIDNFETVAREDESLFRFLRDLPSPSKILITSRLRINTGETVVTLSGLEENDAIQLLKLEAARLQIPVGKQDMHRLAIIARKSHGIPFVLRWVMERVRDGQSLEWAVESLENAGAEDIFDYIFKSSLSLLDEPTRNIFRSLSVLSSWSTLGTIAAINSGTAAIADRVSELVRCSLIEDNLQLTQSARRYQLHPFTRYLANKELRDTDDQGCTIAQKALEHYRMSLQNFRISSKDTEEYLKAEFANLDSIIHFACNLSDRPLLDECINVFQALNRLDHEKGEIVLNYLFDSINRADISKSKFRLQLLDKLANPYIAGIPARGPMLFGRENLLKSIQEIFEDSQLRSTALALVGPQRIGKTSVLYALLERNNVSSNCLYVLADLQRKDASGSIKYFLYYLSRNIENTVKNTKSDIEIEEMSPSIEVFKIRPFEAFDICIQKARCILGDARLILILDEFEILSRFGRRNANELIDLFSYFRSSITRGIFSLLIVGSTSLHDIEPNTPMSPFSNIVNTIHISFLSREDAISLIKRPIHVLLEYSPEAIEYLLRLTSGHPYFLQLLCFQIVQLCREQKSLLIDVVQVDAAKDALLSTEERRLLSYINYELSKTQRKVLQVAAQHESFTENSFTKRFTKDSRRHVSATLLALEAKGYLVKDEGNVYRFTMELFRFWFLKGESLEEEPFDLLEEKEKTTERITTMKSNKQEPNGPDVVNTTHIGYVTGPVHTGSGNINIDTLSYSAAISTKEDFLTALRAFKSELEAVRQQGLPEETFDDTIVEVEAAEREANKGTSKPDRIVTRLERAKAILTAGTGTVTAVTAVVEASNKLIPFIEAAIQAVSKVFH